jgi:hypothetical protein
MQPLQSPVVILVIGKFLHDVFLFTYGLRAIFHIGSLFSHILFQEKEALIWLLFHRLLGLADDLV